MVVREKCIVIVNSPQFHYLLGTVKQAEIGQHLGGIEILIATFSHYAKRIT